MANYKFETEPLAEMQSLVVSLGKMHQPIGRFRKWTPVWFKEEAFGRLVVSDATEIEAEVLKRSLFIDGKLSWSNGKPIVFTEEQKVKRIKEIQDDKKLTTVAGFSRSSADKEFIIDRNGDLAPYWKGHDLIIGEGLTQHIGFNLRAVRSVMLTGIEREYQKDGTAQTGHFVEVADTADRMSREVFEEIGDSSLVAVHGLTLHKLQELALDRLCGVEIS